MDAANTKGEGMNLDKRFIDAVLTLRENAFIKPSERERVQPILAELINAHLHIRVEDVPSVVIEDFICYLKSFEGIIDESFPVACFLLGLWLAHERHQRLNPPCAS